MTRSYNSRKGISPTRNKKTHTECNCEWCMLRRKKRRYKQREKKNIIQNIRKDPNY